ncbi:Na+/H+ antiporter subunit E [Desulfobacula sp.]|uniref:Na+/H+ antiporter subunit E n=1 Tax=Desulfobacula sp. TaxID=2593537 RepID=UPI0026079F59|nr:Na+/H+ antiporter subunit E [Desulfobacula sp.]
MTYLILNLIFAGAWVLVNNEYSIIDFSVGFLLGLACLWLIQPFGMDTAYFRRLKAAVVLLVYFHYEMMVSVCR